MPRTHGLSRIAATPKQHAWKCLPQPQQREHSKLTPEPHTLHMSLSMLQRRTPRLTWMQHSHQESLYATLHQTSPAPGDPFLCLLRQPWFWIAHLQLPHTFPYAHMSLQFPGNMHKPISSPILSARYVQENYLHLQAPHPSSHLPNS